MSSGFVSETELAEARKRRQEEWEKVRTADEPLERPEEPYDGRSLYEKLKDQKMKKDMEFEEAHKLKNLIRGLDDDEVQFLELVDQNKLNAEKHQSHEDELELKEFRNRVATLQEEHIEKKHQTEIAQPKLKSLVNSQGRPTQKALLSAGIKRKNGDVDNSSSSSSKITKNVNIDIAKTAAADANNLSKQKLPPRVLDRIQTAAFDRGELKCIAVLPGLGPYSPSSDSELSTGSEEEPGVEISDRPKYDLLGRLPQRKKQCHDE